jgi:16S rRNA (uracil1498-N3)-methyltransferase
MPRYDFRSPRVFLEQPISAQATLALDAQQSHYLADVLRLTEGDAVLVFNGRDGEWQATLTRASKKALALTPQTQTREQTPAGDLHYLFAPLKRARLDYMVQKAVEMGVSRLAPVITRFTQAERVNLERMRANAIEAAEQCGVLAIPEVVEPQPFARALAALAPERVLIFCDEAADNADPITSLRNAGERGKPLAVIIGPEGGFADEERKVLMARPGVIRLPLGPRILRADTAAVAALAVVQSVLGDWA